MCHLVEDKVTSCEDNWDDTGVGSDPLWGVGSTVNVRITMTLSLCTVRRTLSCNKAGSVGLFYRPGGELCADLHFNHTPLPPLPPPTTITRGQRCDAGPAR